MLNGQCQKVGYTCKCRPFNLGVHTLLGPELVEGTVMSNLGFGELQPQRITEMSRALLDRLEGVRLRGVRGLD